jgi:hypothetical protein
VNTKHFNSVPRAWYALNIGSGLFFHHGQTMTA